MALDHALGEKLTRTIEFLDSNPVLETRCRRLRSQVETLDWIAIQKQFVNRILGQTGRIVRVRISAGDREHTLCHQLAQRVIHLDGLALVAKARSQTSHQSVAAIGGFQQQGSSVRTSFALIELGCDRLAKNSREQQTLCCAIFRHSEASFVAANRSRQHVCNRGGFFCLQISSPSRIMRARPAAHPALNETSADNKLLWQRWRAIRSISGAATATRRHAGAGQE